MNNVTWCKKIVITDHAANDIANCAVISSDDATSSTDNRKENRA